MAENRKVNVEEAAEKAMKEHKGNGKQFVIWIAALIVCAVLGWQGRNKAGVEVVAGHGRVQ